LFLDGRGEGARLESEAAATFKSRVEFSSSEYAKTIHEIVAGAPPAIDLAAERRLIDCLVALASEKAIVSAHDVSDGGLAVALAECCFDGAGLSADARIAGGAEEAGEVAMFGERGARAVVSVTPGSLARVSAIAAQYGVGVQRLGNVTRGEFCIQYKGAGVIRGGVDSFRQTWAESLGKILEGA
jgi:phosphoribosylformylglycinamidine synthase subunit PurL